MDNLTVGSQATMTSREIADLAESRHDSVKRAIERLAQRSAITLPPLVETSFTGADGKTQRATEYQIGKRDSYVIVAQLSPEFTACLVDRWQALESRIAVPAAVDRKVSGELLIAESFARMCHVSESSRIAILAHIGKANGLDTNSLPHYAVDAPTFPGDNQFDAHQAHLRPFEGARDRYCTEDLQPSPARHGHARTAIEA